MKHAAALIALAVAVPLAPAAHAGPPLVCHAVETGGAPSLPWNTAVNDRAPGYETKNLVRDASALLASGVPVLARMETLRRAALYASHDASAGKALQETLIARATQHPSDALAVFDAAYFSEAWNQADMRGNAHPDHAKPLGDSAYAWVKRALALSGGNPEIEYAAALMSAYPRRPEHETHVARASAAAKGDVALAKNLAWVASW